MNHRVEVFVTNSRQDLQPYAVVFQLARRNIMRAAVDGNIMSTTNESGRKVFGKRFKAAVAGRYASRSQNGYSHFFKTLQIGASSRIRLVVQSSWPVHSC